MCNPISNAPLNTYISMGVLDCVFLKYLLKKCKVISGVSLLLDQGPLVVFRTSLVTFYCLWKIDYLEETFSLGFKSDLCFLLSFTSNSLCQTTLCASALCFAGSEIIRCEFCLRADQMYLLGHKCKCGIYEDSCLVDGSLPQGGQR